MSFHFQSEMKKIIRFVSLETAIEFNRTKMGDDDLYLYLASASSKDISIEAEKLGFQLKYVNRYLRLIELLSLLVRNKQNPVLTLNATALKYKPNNNDVYEAVEAGLDIFKNTLGNFNGTSTLSIVLDIFTRNNLEFHFVDSDSYTITLALLLREVDIISLHLPDYFYYQSQLPEHYPLMTSHMFNKITGGYYDDTYEEYIRTKQLMFNDNRYASILYGSEPERLVVAVKLGYTGPTTPRAVYYFLLRIFPSEGDYIRNYFYLLNADKYPNRKILVRDWFELVIAIDNPFYVASISFHSKEDEMRNILAVENTFFEESILLGERIFTHYVPVSNNIMYLFDCSYYDFEFSKDKTREDILTIVNMRSKLLRRLMWCGLYQITQLLVNPEDLIVKIMTNGQQASFELVMTNKVCTNTHDVFFTEFKEGINLTYGTFTDFKCVSIEELLNAFIVDGSIIRWRSPFESRCFPSAIIRDLVILLPALINALEDPKPAVELLNKILVGLKAESKIGPITSIENKTSVVNMLHNLFRAGMYQRGWLGPNHPYPMKTKETVNVGQDYIDEKMNVELGKFMNQYGSLNDHDKGIMEKLVEIVYEKQSNGVYQTFSELNVGIMNIVREVIEGTYCVAVASVYLIFSSHYYLTLLGVTSTTDMTLDLSAFEAKSTNRNAQGVIENI